MKNPNSVFNVKKQGGSDNEVILCFSTTFEVSADLTVLESYNRFEIHHSSLS